MSKRLLFLFSIFLFSFLPLTPVFAVNSEVLDQRCFTETDCENARDQIGQPREGGFYIGSEADICGQMYGSNGGELERGGFCLPASTANLQVSIGGRKDFPNIAEYIKYVYRYSVFAALTIAVVMVIFAGLQWILAGGQSDKISAAKKRITNAIIGLLLIGTSYTILNTINPALVNLRLPQVWMIREQALMSPFCSNIASTTPLYLARTGGVETPPIPEGQTRPTVPQADAACGNDYQIAGGGQMCKGTTCSAPNQTCGKRPWDILENCIEGNIIGEIYSSSMFTSIIEGSTVLQIADTIFGDGYEWKWVDGTMHLYAVCNLGQRKEVRFASGDVVVEPPLSDDLYKEFYRINTNLTALNNAQGECGSSDGGFSGGYVLAIDLNETGTLGANETHLLGKSGGTAIDLGDEDYSLFNNCLMRLYGRQYLLTSEDVMSLNLSINVSDIADLDSGDDLVGAYGHFGDISSCLNIENESSVPADAIIAPMGA